MAGCRVGISIRPATPVEKVFPYLGEVDMVLVMSVEPGFGGQAFLPETPSRLAAVRRELDRRGLTTDLQVDGGVNDDTAPLCVKAGANVLVVGSALYHAADPAALTTHLHNLIHAACP